MLHYFSFLCIQHSASNIIMPSVAIPNVALYFSFAERGNAECVLAYSNVSREKGLLLSFVYKFGQVACRCC